MRKTLLLILLISISTTEIIACTCAREKASLERKVKTEFNRSDLIFTGKVISKVTKTNEEYFSLADPTIYTFEIIEKIKGTFQSTNVEIVSEESGASCGYNFEIGQQYLVYSINSDQFTSTTANKHDFVTDLCRRNQKINTIDKREIKKLRKLGKRIDK
ncbi:MAG: hypothetical protein CMC13_00445 [Flavobacteriaceae bacterium]|nr:hypothetical protein [Flavobacteriaceae bacterium]